MARWQAVAAAIAVSLLAVSGAGGTAGQQTPKRGGTVVVRGPIREPACLRTRRASRVRPGARWACASRSQAAFIAGPTRWRPELVSHSTSRRIRSRSRTTSVPRRAGATGCRSARGTSSSPTRRSSGTADSKDDDFSDGYSPRVAVDAKTVRFVLRSRYARLAEPLLDSSCRGTRLRARTSPRSGATGSTTRRRAGRSGAGLSSSGAGSAAKQLTLVRNPQLLGAAPRLPRPHRRAFLSGARATPRAARRSRSRRGRSCASAVTPGLPRSSGDPRLQAFSRALNGLGALRDPHRRAATPRFRASSSAVRSPTASTASRSSGALRRDRSRPSRSSDSAIYLTNEPRTTGRTGTSTATGPPLLAGCSSRRAAAAGADGIYVCAGRAALAPLRDSCRRNRAERARSSSSRRSFGRSGSRSCPVFAHVSLFEQLLPSGDFDAASLGSTTARPDRIEGHLRLRRFPELQRLLPAARDERPRPGRPDPRCRPAGPRPQPGRPADREGRAGHPALPGARGLRRPEDHPRIRPCAPLDPSGTRRTGGSSASGPGALVPPARLELALLDPQLRRELRLVASHLLDEALGVLAPDEPFQLDTEWEVGRESIVHNCVGDHCRRS